MTPWWVEALAIVFVALVMYGAALLLIVTIVATLTGATI